MDSLDGHIKQLKENKKKLEVDELKVIEKYMIKKAQKEKEFEDSLNKLLQKQEEEI